MISRKKNFGERNFSFYRNLLASRLENVSSNQLMSTYFVVGKEFNFTKILLKYAYPTAWKDAIIGVKLTFLLLFILKKYLKSYFHGSFLIVIAFYSNFQRCAQCGNYITSLSHFFRKNFVKTTVLLKKLLNT